jgi:phosphoribosylaminoimidazolecarboxamide formyltransferase/IMP cyclohydrolase
MNHEITLRYGSNPQQIPARAYTKTGQLPLEILNGLPSYINLLDALNSWQLVKELREALGLPAAASFKHVSPAGAAVSIPLTETLARSYFVDDIELSPLAVAYARARGADRVSSFGDWIALSDKVDFATATLISREVSDGIIAPAFDLDALKILRKKRQGKYPIIQIDPDYEPQDLEARDIFGITLEQKRNTVKIRAELLDNIVTCNKHMPFSAKRDLIVALIALKYTQSNSVCFASDGQILGMGAGQQSRIHCTRLAASKAETWYLRQHPAVLSLQFKPGIRRPDRDNAIDQYLREDLTLKEEERWGQMFEKIPARLTPAQKRAWLDQLHDICFGSDAYIPFRDNIDRAYQTGVRFVAQSGGSLRDHEVIAACDEYGIVMCFTNVRLFHH